MTQRRRWVAFALVMMLPITLNAQNERVTPQVLSTTILIDRDTDLESLREQLLRAYKNTSIKEVQDVRVWHELALSIKLFLKSVKVEINDNSDLKIIEKTNEELFSKNLSIYDKTILELAKEIATACSAQIDAIINSRLGDDPIEGRVVDKLNMIGNAILQLPQEVKQAPILRDSVKTLWAEIKNMDDKIERTHFLISKITDVFVFIASTNGNTDLIAEVDRVKAIAEIINELHKIIDECKFNLDGGKELFIEAGNVSFKICLSDSIQIDELAYELTARLYQIMKSDLINRVGQDHPAVKYFDDLYVRIQTVILKLHETSVVVNTQNLISDIAELAKLKESIEAYIKTVKEQFKNSSDSSAINNKFNELDSLIKVSISKIKNPSLAKGVRLLHQALTEFNNQCNELIRNKRKLEEGRNELLNSMDRRIEKLNEELILECLIRPAVEYTIRTVIPELREAIVSKGKFEFLNHFGISDKPEIGTVLVYKLFDDNEKRLEVFSNVLFSKPRTDSSATIGQRNFIIGLCGKASNEITEIGMYQTTTFLKFADLLNLSSDSKSSYNFGGYLAIKGKALGVFRAKAIHRFFLEAESSQVVAYGKNVRTSAGMELRFTQSRFVSGIFYQYSWLHKKKLSTIGITFPAIK
ncbi:hypothetical protein K1X84_13435 [bacterium]|nr:hypothetical protein [bacterium]